MEGKYTFANAEYVEWIHGIYDNQTDAFEAAEKEFETFLVGQLRHDGMNYKIVNVVEFNEIKHTPEEAKGMTVKGLIELLQKIDGNKEVDINVRSYYKKPEKILEFEGQNRIIIS